MVAKKIKTIFFCVVFVSILVLFVSIFSVLMGSGTKVRAENTFDIVKRPGSSIIVPDQFLRRWDPVTLFFDGNEGPGDNIPEDNPQKFVTLSPDHPGAYTWLDRKTLQFRPAEPWPPLTRFEWKVKSKTVSLATLMSTPVETLPQNNAEGLEPVEAITLTFPEPIDPAALAKMITIELRPLPGVGQGRSRWLDDQNFEVKILERQNRADQAGYVLMLNDPIPLGIKATIHMRLSLEDEPEDAFYKITFSTAEPFYITNFGCSNQLYPVTRNGVGYTSEQAIRCTPGNQQVEVRFSSRPAHLGPIEARNLVRFTPAVKDLQFNTIDERLTVTGKFEADTLYQVTLEPTRIVDENGRELQMEGPSSLFVFFPLQSSFLNWKAGQGIVELYGPQMVPLSGRGFERLDLRIYAVDPLNRSLWPFPEDPVVVNEMDRPPGPGEEPGPYTNVSSHISSSGLGRQIKALGSPSISTLVTLPLKKAGSSANFGLDLKPYLEEINGEARPGTFLVGIRKLDNSKNRSWIRVQVTDLCLTTVEEAEYVKFIVTSIATGRPVANAEVVVEGAKDDTWGVAVSGKTDPDGIFSWKAPGYRSWREKYSIRRIYIKKGEDRLVLDPTTPPDKFQNNVWEKEYRTWLQWTQESLSNRTDSVQILCHLFTERPVYKPDDPVHIKGYIRENKDGDFSTISGSGLINIDGPGDLEWRYPVEISKAGSFYHLFDEKELPTGEYRAWFEYNGNRYGSVSFKKEAFRLPKFEVKLSGPDKTGLDEEFQVQLTADYYAGGRVAKQPVRWRVTQFPYTWTPKKRDGYFYSTDARFSNQGQFRSTPLREKEDQTDEQGSAFIHIDPTVEPTAQPRRYVVEATVTGADDQTVSDTHQVFALPPFVLGLKTPRYLQNADRIEPEIIVAGPDGELLADREITVRLLQRQWHSYLQAGDFSQNAAKYVTDVVDKKISEQTVTSQKQPLKLNLPIDRSGVYIIEIEAQDKLGRTQVVSVDLFAGGAEPVTWSQPPTKVFKVTSDKKEYAPGETAVMILESPFQRAQALAIIEVPDGKNIYKWVNIKNGTATFKVKVEKPFMPRIPIHFVLMRGRVDDGKPYSANQTDLGKPATLATTSWLEVSTVKHKVNMELAYPSKAQPGDEIEMKIKLTDDTNQAISGEVTLWLVDQAVLALGEEQPLDPISDFIVSRQSHISFHDTRNLTLGYLPYEENPGGDGLAKARAAELLDKVTIRKNFQAVPYYNPAISVGEDGVATVKIKLPDNLTNFKVRAKVVSGTDRFGFAKGHLSIRLPVIVQQSLPRFVRPGDHFSAIAIGRIVEGEGGAGKSEIRVDGLKLDGEAVQTFDWKQGIPERIEYPVSVPTPEYNEKGELSRTSVKVTIGVERELDNAGDAFSVDLPVLSDRKAVVRRIMKDLAADAPITIPAVTEATRPGTLKRSILISGQPGFIRMAAGLDYLLNYPHGCTEQRISRARAYLAAKHFRDIMYQKDGEEKLVKTVNQTLEWIESVEDDNGLVAYWPGTDGNVSLTAWVVQFMVEARNAGGFQINEELFDRLTHSLKNALRSDYRYFINGASYAERCWALTALADAGELDTGYAAELARRANYLDLESKAQVVYALFRSGEKDSALLKKLMDDVWNGVVFRLYQGNEIYGGLQETAGSRNALILPSETRTLAEVIRAASLSNLAAESRQQVLVNGLVTLGQDDGWGSTNANGAALLSLSTYISGADTTTAGSDEQLEVKVVMGDTSDTTILKNRNSMRHVANDYSGEIQLSHSGPPNEEPLIVRSETTYVPREDGSNVAAFSQGFVVGRELLKIQKGDIPAEKITIEKPGSRIQLMVGDIIEEHVEVVNPEDRNYVAVVVPLAAGMEPLNPNLATAPPEATPSGQTTLTPTYVAFMDDQMAYYYNSLPKGTYHFYFRTQAAIPGEYIQPVAFSEMMYQQAVNGNSNGAKIKISPKPEE